MLWPAGKNRITPQPHRISFKQGEELEEEPELIIQVTRATSLRESRAKLTEAIGSKNTLYKLNKEKGKRAYLRALKKAVKRKMKKNAN